ncbi:MULTISPECIES: glutamyl-tRNA reductase [Ectothiorhodospira]|jgi:glutamyl-tRNA reductase|uniref:Glutamyl-tRNA reductase n=1 Tax=Ectothiorhodospira marina TaxID=1396821 RepID=A0A1H7NR35_9GAMM|nr:MULTISPECIES: glutamyl-tRNA reductase [Ectothiorhodospira]MCG5516652.1 glutamyl-tRNA reductase [Ectothiorhodospira sp. 9100]MCG5519570.1 glutamyl-tRNA reductase [Ectothiorhodospira sp. 9905]SEL25801.1 glutamyl-tRNA reductase [Ectothiorhodospira marina]
MLFTLGVNHKSAPVGIRERVVFSPERMEEALNGLTQSTPVEEAAILSTCNRTEIYFRSEAHQPADRVLHWLGEFHRLKPSEIQPYIYRHHDDDAVRHLLRVACGLDSLVLGEPQILGQLKGAYQNANTSGTLGRQLGRLFQHAFSVAKNVRTSTAIGSSPVSVAFAAVSLAKQIWGDMKPLTALMIGAGETVELAARHLSTNEIGRIIVANRTVERAKPLADQFNAEVITLQEIPNRLAEADILISSTASPLPILGKGAVERALKVRKHRPMFMVDIAVPRDIEPEVGKLDDVYLYTVDDLEEVIQENLQSRREAARQAEEIIESQVDSFMGWLRAQDAVSTICAFRDKAHSMQVEVLDKSLQMVAAGKSPEEALGFLAHTLTNKFLHEPCDSMNQAARDGKLELIDAAHALFKLPETDTSGHKINS